MNPLYLLVDEIDGFIEETEGSKYLSIASTGRNSEVLKKYEEVWSGIKNFIEKVNDSKSGQYGKYYMKIKFNSDDNFLLYKILTFCILTIIFRSVFEEGGYYPISFLHGCLYEL